jgi:PHD/YefM family antitoxin component YafN of YafNO toxin-antitoxin module
MVSIRNIHALDHFKRNTADFRARLRRTGEPEVLTVDGKPELVVQYAESYQKLLDLLDELETLAAIREGLADADAGRVRPARDVLRDLRAKFRKPQPPRPARRTRR